VVDCQKHRQSGGRSRFDGRDLVKLLPEGAKGSTYFWETVYRAEIRRRRLDDLLPDSFFNKDDLLLEFFPSTTILFRRGLPGVPGHLSIVHLVDKLNESRTERIKRACGKKFDKLAAWKGQSARTILIFEENDDQRTNVIGVTESFLKAATGMPNQPDELYLVTSSHASWYVWCVRRDGKSFFDFTTADERAYEVDPDLLASLTER
jgi:hypothetical protein